MASIADHTSEVIQEFRDNGTYTPLTDAGFDLDEIDEAVTHAPGNAAPVADVEGSMGFIAGLLVGKRIAEEGSH